MTPGHTGSSRSLSDAQISQFITDGFVRIDNAFPRRLADAARTLLWRDTGCNADNPATWTRPVIRLGMYDAPPFIDSANTPALHDAFDQLVGVGRWVPCMSMGTFPVRFPSPDDPGDAGWHVDASFGWEHPDFMEWRVNVASRGRALLMLFLFSDIGEDDAPTRIRIGSHLDITRQLAMSASPCANWRRMALPARPRDRRRWPSGKLARSICATRSWCTAPSRIAERGHASWPSRRCFPRNR